MGVLLVLVGFVGFVVGVISLVRPLRALRINDRKTAAIVAGASFVLMMVGAALTPTDSSDSASGTTTTTTLFDLVIFDEASTTTTDATTTTQSTTTTTTATTTTTRATTTTTTLPSVLAEGSGRGDDVVQLDLPATAVVIDIIHEGRGNIAIWSLDSGFNHIDLLVNEIGDYEGTRPMQFLSDELVSGLEITAGGDWTYVVRPLEQVDRRSCTFEGEGDDVVIVNDFLGSGGPAALTNAGDSNFSIWAYGSNDRDLIVNEIGPYEGTVLVGSGLAIWDITATGGWTVDC